MAPEFVTLDEYSYIDDPGKLKTTGCGFSHYDVQYNHDDMYETYLLIADMLTMSFENIEEAVYEIYSPSQYFNELIRNIDDGAILYTFRNRLQEKDVILFLVSYVK